MTQYRLVAALALAAAGPAAAQPGPLRGLDDYVTRALAAWEAPAIAVAVVRNDSVVHARGYGVRERGRPEPATAQTVFAIGSTSKAFTSALLGMLVDQGRVAWDDPVTRHLPGFQLFDPYVTREITIRDLLTHRSGLARGDRLWAGSGMSREAVLRRVRFLEPSWSFRSTYGYQNIMFLAAGELAGRVLGTSWDAAIAERIFTPLGMRRSVTSVGPLKGMDDVATPHERFDGRVTPVEWLDIDNIGPAGSINSSVADMAQWIRLQLGLGTVAGRKLIDSATVREMHTLQMPIRPSQTDEKLWPESHLMGYGLAWSLRDYRGVKIVSHGGAIRGMRAWVALVPERRLGVVVLTNLAESPLPTALGMRVIDQHLGAPVKDWSGLYLAEAKEARADLDSRRAALDAREQELAARVAELDAREQELAAREAAPAVPEKPSDTVSQAPKAVAAATKKLEARSKKLDARAEQLDARDAALGERTAELEQLAIALVERETAAAEHDAALDGRQAELAEQEASLAERAAALDARERELAERERESDTVSQASEPAEAAADELAAVEAKLAELREAERAFARTHAELAARSDALAEREAAIAARERAVAAAEAPPTPELEALEARIRRLEQGGKRPEAEPQTFSAGLRALQERGLRGPAKDEPLH